MPEFSDRFLKDMVLAEGQKDRLVFDTACPGLGVRLTTKGTRTFIVQWTDPATRRKLREPLGVWGSITVKQARDAARARLGEVAKGVDVRAERVKRRQADEQARAEAALTLDALIEDWADLHLVHRRPRYAAEAKRALRLAFSTALKRPAAHLSRAAVVNTLDGLAKAGKAAMAGRTMAYGRACYRWAAKRGKVPGNPFADLPISAGATERDRVLSDDELAAVWDAAGRLEYPFGPYVRLLILTMARREEVAGMRWSEIAPDLSRWTIPAARSKNGKPHDVHLAGVARDILAAVPRVDGQDLVFSTTGTTPISGISKMKARLDDAAKVTDWRLHDLRRTGVSRLAAMGFDSIVADMLLAHKPGKLRGVAAVYQRHDFAPERARALEAWASVLTGQRQADVIDIREAATQRR